MSETPTPQPTSEATSAPLVKIRKRFRPALVTIGDRTISVNGWRVPLVLDHLRWHLTQGLSGQWCVVPCMADTMFQRRNKSTCEDVRARVGWTFRKLLALNQFVTIDYTGPRGQIKAMKLFDAAAGEIELQAAKRQLERMRGRREVTGEAFERALALIGSQTSAF
jgi:hypothetical protein